MARRVLKRYRRYLKYTLQWLFLEKLRGLDFTMRDLSLLKETDGVLHGYSKTDDLHAREIFKALDVDKQKSILDIGCGKGAFLKEATEYDFSRIAGLEYVEELADIAKKNFKRLKLDKRIEIYCGDAAEFNLYGEFNVFYFFNPFDRSIMDNVIKKIIEKKKDKIWVVLHNPVCADVVIEHGGKEINRLYDKMKSYETVIYEIE